MTAETTATMPKPRITSTERTSAFWEAASQGTLLLQRCGQCNHMQHYARPMCVACWSPNVSWEAAAGTGVIWTFTVVGMPGHPAWRPDTPYVLAIVELDEGPRLMTNIVDCRPDDIAVGQRVVLRPTLQPDTNQTILTFALASNE